MVDATRVFEPGFQVTNAAGTPQSGAVLRFYDAGTSNTRTVYSNSGLSTSLGVTVTTNASGRPAASGGAGAETLIYTGTTAYKVTAETSAAVSLWSFDNVIGALDTSTFLTGSVIAEFPVASKTANYPVVDADQGKVFNANPTGGSFTVTLPSAVTVGNGWSVTVRHVGTANSVNVATVSGQTIDGATFRNLEFQFESITLVSDGANWHSKETTQQILPRAYIDGCRLSNGTDTTNDINIAAGVCRDSTNSVNITVQATAGKQLDSNWASGASAGMRNSASGIANSTYHIYAVRTAASAIADFYAYEGVDGTDPDTSANVATVLTALQAEVGGSSYIYARRIGSILRSGGAILGFIQRGDQFDLKTSVMDYNQAAPGTSALTIQLGSVPEGLGVWPIFSPNLVHAGGSEVHAFFNSLDLDVEAAGTGNGSLGNATTFVSQTNISHVRTNTSRQIRGILSTSTSVTLQVMTRGWVDLRGKEAA